MKTQEIQIGNKTVIHVVLAEETMGIEEVVAVGYGTMKKSDLTGSVTQVKIEDVSSKAINTFEQLLQGAAAGVQITQSSGAPGSGININIRGVTTLSGTSQPLVVIDGFTIDNSISSTVGGEVWTNGQPAYNALATLNPNDIESIEILKDASATAIYGSRGANGVMIITTKTGKQGKDQINYSFRTDISSLPKKISVLNTSDFIDYSNEAYANSNMGVLYPDSIRDEIGMVNTNWQDLLYRTAISQDHQVTISGKNNKDTYSVMGAYSKQNGILIDTKYERISGRVNFERTVSRRLSLGYNINAVYATNNAAQQSHSNGNPSGSVVTGALNFRPLVRAYNEEGDFDVSTQSNPLYMAKLTEDDMTTTDYNIGLYLDYNVLKDLKFKSRIASRDSKTSREVYFPRGTYPGDVFGGFAYKNENSFKYYLFENTLSYIKQFNSIHRINAVAGYTWQKWAQKAIGLQASGFPNDNLTYNNFSLANNIPNPVISNTECALASALGRFNYVLKDRYLVTFTGRYDGASRLSENNKWAFFPSAALGGNVHNEEFLKSFKFISQLKLRGSYGFSGNQNIAVGATQAKLETNTGAREAIGNNIYTRFLFNSFSNADLGWEITKQLNAGFDLSFLKNKLRFTFDYYIKNTSDLLIYLSIPSASGYSSYPTNVGEIQNKGAEFSLDANIIDKTFKWNLSGNISFNKNKVINLGNTSATFGDVYLKDTNLALGQPLHITKAGSPLGSYYGYKIGGIYQNETEITDGPEDTANPEPGDFKFVDISGPDGVPDGKITSDDRTIIGNPYPDFIFGITNDFSWKNFSLSFLIQGNIGQDVINLNNYALASLNRSSQTNVLKEAWEQRWTGEGTSNTYPKAKMGGSGPFSKRFTDFLVEDGSFVRLKNITLSYNLQQKFLSDLGIKNLKLIASATNLLTLTKYSGYDPEVNGSNRGGLTPGVDFGTIPQYRTFSLGININF
jgi:TonB-linked SusC/RagA family outer membrane protein